jgi:hypothetical protein
LVGAHVAQSLTETPQTGERSFLTSVVENPLVVETGR